MIKPNKNEIFRSFRRHFGMVPALAGQNAENGQRSPALAGRSARGKLYFCLVCLILLPGIAAAQTRLDMALPEIANQPAPSEGLPAFINYLFVFGLGAIALLALAQMMRGGIEYVLAAGNVVKHEDAKDTIQQALIGMGLLLVSYLLLNTINPDLVNLKEPKFELLEFKGDIPAGMSVADFLRQNYLADPAINELLKKLSKQPNGNRITTDSFRATKISDKLFICDSKGNNCTYSPLIGDPFEGGASGGKGTNKSF